MSAFAAKVTAWCAESSERMLAVRKASIQRLVDEIQTPVARGGNLPVDTGFLRASLTAAVGRVSFAARPAPDGPAPSYDPGRLDLVLAQAGPDDTITVGWTANYARAVEFGARGRPGRLFVTLGLQRWPQIVAETAATAFIRNQGRGA